MAIAYDVPRLLCRAWSQPGLNGPVHLHPPGMMEEVSQLESEGANRRQSVSLAWILVPVAGSIKLG